MGRFPGKGRHYIRRQQVRSGQAFDRQQALERAKPMPTDLHVNDVDDVYQTTGDNFFGRLAA